MRRVGWNCRSKLFSTSLWCRESGGTIWLVVKLPGAPSKIDALMRLQAGCVSARVVLPCELLKVKIGEYIQGNVMPIPLQEFKYLLMLLISIRTVVKGHSNLLDIRFYHSLLPTSEFYEGHPPQEGIILADFYST